MHCCITCRLVGLLFSRSGVFNGDNPFGDRARLEYPRQGFFPAKNVRALNPWHFDSRFPAAKCVFELENKLSGERNSSADTVVSPSPESALVGRIFFPYHFNESDKKSLRLTWSHNGGCPSSHFDHTNAGAAIGAPRWHNRSSPPPIAARVAGATLVSRWTPGLACPRGSAVRGLWTVMDRRAAHRHHPSPPATPPPCLTNPTDTPTHLRFLVPPAEVTKLCSTAVSTNSI